MRKLVILLFRGWKICISPFLGRRCRFLPTCSEYGVEAVEEHGVLKGCYLTARRLLRCHPFCEAGYDPVPRQAATPAISPGSSEAR